MRDTEGRAVEVRCRPPMLLHELTSGGSNEEKPHNTRLPPPSLPLLTRHDRLSLALEIERHIEFTVESEKQGPRSVALHPVFVEHYLAFRDSKLPRVDAVVTAPLVLADGTLLAPQGLDRERRLVFRIEPALVALLPVPGACSTTSVADALRLLANEWLIDVATDFTGRCVLIALALTILERVLLPERPAFFVTAGKRGGGKTTALMMVILAVTGKKPPAAAWSASEEERRKAILSYLAEGLAVLVWDNIPIGASVSCPTLEKVLTAESYSDRILGQSATATVPALTVQTFTGNNISPGGDMVSRSLVVRLEVDRPDPENRSFRHADPVTWTLDNRGAILQALYTILLGNRQLHPQHREEPKTRFKWWGHLVGSAVENAAGALVRLESGLTPERRTATPIDFGVLFSQVEDEDEETNGLADAFDALHATWPDRYFQAADVAKLINEPMDGEADISATLRAFFETSGARTSGSASVTPKSVGRRLKAVCGAPVWVGDRTMKLAAKPADTAAHKRASWFRVQVS